MKTPHLFAALLLLLLPLAGCLDASAPAAAANVPLAPAAATGAPAEADGTSDAAADTLRSIEVTGTYSDYGYGVGWPTCATPPDCTAHIPFGVHFTGTFDGDGFGVAHANLTEPSTPERFGAFYKQISYTGAIADCGTGTLAFYVTGWGAIEPGGFHTNETIQYIPGSASAGLSGLVEAYATFDKDPYAWPGTVELTGTVLCR